MSVLSNIKRTFKRICGATGGPEMGDFPAITLTDGSPVTDDHREINPDTGMQKDYVVLSAEERAKGFVRPVRQAYVHVGRPGPQHPLEDLTAEVRARYAKSNYDKYERYPEGESAVKGRFWTKAQLDNVGKGCGSVTTMSVSLAETYSRNPGFYGGTFCARCKKHLPVGKDGEFLWDGTEERVGT